MPFNDELFYGKAIRSDVAGVAIKTARALGEIAFALERIQRGESTDDNIKQIRDLADSLDEVFNELTGYTP